MSLPISWIDLVKPQSIQSNREMDTIHQTKYISRQHKESAKCCNLPLFSNSVCQILICATFSIDQKKNILLSSSLIPLGRLILRCEPASHSYYFAHFICLTFRLWPPEQIRPPSGINSLQNLLIWQLNHH